MSYLSISYRRAPRRVRRHPARRLGHGVATLTMVMVLFFVMAMVAAYANRNLIYEQRISVNNLRATSAMSAADAGVDWAIAMLNGGLVDTSCAANAAGASTFRGRYLQLQADGSYTIPTWAAGAANRAIITACVMTTAPWTCHCPTTGVPNFAAVTEAAPVFRLEVLQAALPGVPSPGPRPGAIVVKSQGCANFNSLSADPNYEDAYYAACHKSYGQTRPRVDAVANVQVTLGLVRALPTPPQAALTAGNTISMAGANPLTVSNTAAQAGVTLHAGSALPVGTVVVLQGPAGSIPASTDRTGDANLFGLVAPPAGEPGMFESLFGMDQATYSRQPAAVFVNCAAGCTSADIGAPMAANPGRILWIAGNINLDQAGVLGSAAQPLMLVASGDVSVSAAVTVNGFVYAARDINVLVAGSSIIGAAVAGRNFTGQAPTIVAYDADMLRSISIGYGSFVKVPGSWQATAIQ